MNLGQMIQTARGRYGDSRYAVESELLPHPVMVDLANEAHRWLAEEVRCYRQKQEYNLPLGADGLSTVSLQCNVIAPVKRSLRIKVGSDWRAVELISEDEAWSRYELFDNLANATPVAGFMRLGTAFDAQRVLELVPGSDTAVTSGVRTWADIYPARMTEDTHVPALQPAEHDRLIPVMCWKMAERVRESGRPADPLYWQRLAFQAATDLRRIMRGFLAGSRGSEVRYRPEDFDK